MTATTLQDLKPAQIKPHKLNPRRQVGDVTELAASIREQGVVEPLIVAPNGSDETYILIAGHRRLAAAKVAKLKVLPCLVREDLTDPKKQIETMLVENLQRTDLTPLEEAEAYQQLLEFPGYTQKRIADTTGRAIATVRSRLKMTALPKNALEKIHQGQINLTEALALVEFADDKKLYARLERTAGTDQFTRELEAVKTERTKTRKVARLRTQLEAEKVRIITLPTWQTPVTRLFGDEAVSAHRDCEGFCAYIQTDYYSSNATVYYVCDKPELHKTDAHAVDDDLEPPTAEELAEEALKLELIASAGARRSYLAKHVVGEPSEGLALDALRRVAKAAVADQGFFFGPVLDYDPDDENAAAASLEALTLAQLAIVVDLADFGYEDRALEHPYSWPVGGRNYDPSKDWRERLTGLYGYTWSPVEQKMVDAIAASQDDATGKADE